jgi:hypothetical protein
MRVGAKTVRGNSEDRGEAREADASYLRIEEPKLVAGGLN